MANNDFIEDTKFGNANLKSPHYDGERDAEKTKVQNVALNDNDLQRSRKKTDSKLKMN